MITAAIYINFLGFIIYFLGSAYIFRQRLRKNSINLDQDNFIKIKGILRIALISCMVISFVIIGVEYLKVR